MPHRGCCRACPTPSRSFRGWAYLPGLLYVAFAGAIISAILSAVHSALHAPASQLSHNIIVRLNPKLGEAGKLWCVRAPRLMALSVIAYLISVSSSHIHDLVETASAFAAPGYSSRRCLHCSPALAGR